MKLINLILICLCLTACATQRKIVYVPTPVKCPEPKFKPEPDYDIKHLIQADKQYPGKVVQAYAVSLKQCMADRNFYYTQVKGLKRE